MRSAAQRVCRLTRHGRWWQCRGGGAMACEAGSYLDGDISGYEQDVRDTVRVAALVGDFRVRGHLCANLDPLRRTKSGPWLSEVPCNQPRMSEHSLQLLLHKYPHNASPDAKAQYAAAHLQLEGHTNGKRKFFVGSVMPGARTHEDSEQYLTLPVIIERLAKCYCGTLAVEMEQLATQEQIDWLTARVENRSSLQHGIQRGILNSLIRAEMFEEFLEERFPRTKRFGIEGCEALLPGLQAIIQRCGHHGVNKIEMGLTHRGRLNVLCNLLDKPLGAVCEEMEEDPSDLHVGDVKYHLGHKGTFTHTSRQAGNSHKVKLTVAPNPSHLEAIYPVIVGMVRAQQQGLCDIDRSKVMGLLVHGDAAFCGLGIVSETLQLSDVPGFSTGGIIHVVINNQIGFTTLPMHGRSGMHPTDIVKMIGAPVLHANADDPEAVWEACEIAADWRAHFKKDVVVDIVGYRRFGHNELDNPVPDLPITYGIIKDHKRIVDIYSQLLQDKKIISEEEVKKFREAIEDDFESEWEGVQRGAYVKSPNHYLSTNWQGEALQEIWGDQKPESFLQELTGLPIKTLQFVGSQICQLPPGFNAHPDVERGLEKRKRMILGPQSRVDWGMAEALAFGTLVLHRGVVPEHCDPKDFMDAAMGLNKGHYHVRLTGQDVERGTFNHRQSVVYDQKTGVRHIKHDEIIPGRQDTVEIWNSPLSESAVMGFEYGYSLGARDRALVLWEAQFGDFANNAQVVIDQFLASGEEKWGQQSGLVILLPHGYDGQGPDHSSARIERYLSLCKDDPDHLPGYSPGMHRNINATFEAIAKEHGGYLTQEQASEILLSVLGEENGDCSHELMGTLWTEMGLPEHSHLTKAVWKSFMIQYIRRNAERNTNMFVVNATTPAQLFHVLRRQCNLPYKKPLIVASPKYLLHHTPCTSALEDFSTGRFFNRVIDDGKSSDNTRHRSKIPDSNIPFLFPPDKISRVILCSGQLYYHLSAARRTRKIRDTVLVRLEQICPFPHDLIIRVISQYANADLVWCQEEPKNMGAWLYVKPRMDTALRELYLGDHPRHVQYVGRPASASAATASFRIHQKETKEIVDAALSH